MAADIKRTPDEADWLAVLRSLETSAAAGISRLDALERNYRDAQRALVAEYRPGALPSLLALLSHRPLLSPQAAADLMGLSVAGASKLLDRAAAAGLVVEITQRRTWRLFLTPDLAETFGYVKSKRGRPRKEPPALPTRSDLTSAFDTFDQEMVKIDELLGSRLPSGLAPEEQG